MKSAWLYRPNGHINKLILKKFTNKLQNIIEMKKEKKKRGWWWEEHKSGVMKSAIYCRNLKYGFVNQTLKNNFEILWERK